MCEAHRLVYHSTLGWRVIKRRERDTSHSVPLPPKSVTLPVGTPLSSYGIAYRRGYGLFTRGLFKKSLDRLLGTG